MCLDMCLCVLICVCVFQCAFVAVFAFSLKLPQFPSPDRHYSPEYVTLRMFCLSYVDFEEVRSVFLFVCLFFSKSECTEYIMVYVRVFV